MSDRPTTLEELNTEIGEHLEAIKKLYKPEAGPVRVMLVALCMGLEHGETVIGDCDPEDAIAAIKLMQKHGPTPGFEGRAR